jgi:hypothetical protein
MAARTFQTRSTVFMVLFDSETQRIVGKGAKWMSLVEFAKDPPRYADDTKGDPGKGVEPPPESKGDPAPYPDCIGGFVHVCYPDPAGAAPTQCWRIEPPTNC